MPLSMPINYASVRTAITQALTLATGLGSGHVIQMAPTKPNSPRPAKPYVAWQLTTPAMAMGWDYDQTYIDTDGTPTYMVSGQRSMSMSVQSFADDHDTANGIMAQVCAAMNVPPVLDAFAQAGIAVWDYGGINDISQLMDVAYEGRAQMDVTFGIASNATLTDADIITQATPLQMTFTKPDAVAGKLGP